MIRNLEKRLDRDLYDLRIFMIRNFIKEER